LACPGCSQPAADSFDFLPQAVASLRFNLRQYGKYLPAAWYVGSLGDHVLQLLFVVFEGARTEGKTGADFEAYLDAKLAGMDWGPQDYLQAHIRDMALRLNALLVPGIPPVQGGR
jgi:hypothetical protein